MRKMSLISCFVFLVSLLAIPAMATNGYQLIGVGSYQKSLGGAVTANPGTAMTSISNPAGMARLSGRADFSVEMFMPERHVDFASLHGESVDSDAELYGIPSIGWVADLGDDHPNWSFGGGMYGTSGLGVDYGRTLMTPGNGSTMPEMHWEGYSSIAFWQMAPSLAYAPSKKFSIGLSLNMDYQQVAFNQRVSAVDGSLIQNFNLAKPSSAFGFGFTLGTLYDVSEAITLGVSYRSKQMFQDLKFNLGMNDIGMMDMGTGTFMSGPAGEYSLALDFPQQLNFGIAVKPMPALTLSADFKWIDWASTMENLTVMGPGGFEMAMDPGWESQTVIAVGAMFQATEGLSLMAGYNHAAAPFDEAGVSSNMILPATVVDHFTVGFDMLLSNHWSLGGHFMSAPEENLTAPNTDPMAPGVEIGLGETSMGINLGYRF